MNLCEILKNQIEKYLPCYKDIFDIQEYCGQLGKWITCNTGKNETEAELYINNETGIINYIQIKEEKRLKGEGTKLCKAIEDFFTEIGCKKIELLSLAGVEKFYEKIDYKLSDAKTKLKSYFKVPIPKNL